MQKRYWSRIFRELAKGQKYKTQKFFSLLCFVMKIYHILKLYTRKLCKRSSVSDNYHVLVSLYSYFNKITIIFAYLALQTFTAQKKIRRDKKKYTLHNKLTKLIATQGIVRNEEAAAETIQFMH